jgi:tRNA U54 and U55 pseudouridine synthase Pus10
VWSNNAAKTEGWTAVEGVYKLRMSYIDEQVIDIPASTGRYLKVEVVSGGAGQEVGSFAEIYGYGK